MSLDEFFSKGLRDAERRLPLLKPVAPHDHERLLALVRSSRVVQFFDGLVAVAAGAVESSAVIAAMRGFAPRTDVWHRRQTVGVALIVAAAVHIGLVIWHERPPSWLWLIVPGLAAASGLLLTILSASREEHG